MSKQNLGGSERELCNAIIEFLMYQGVFCWRTNSGVIRSEYKGKERMIRLNKAGTSDILGIYKGRFIALEVKLPTTRSRVTDVQKEFLQKIKDKGGIADVVCSPEEAWKVITTAK